MKVLASLLILGVFTRHVAVNWLHVGISPYALFYAMGGLWEAILCAVILIFMTAARRSIWVALIRCAMCIGIIEGTQMAACRPLIVDLSLVPSGVDLCDYLAGFPLGKAIMSFYFLLTVWIIGREIATPAP